MTDNQPSQDPRDFLALSTFVEELLKARPPKVPSSELPKYKESLMVQVMEAVNSRLIGMLDEAAQKELETLLSTNPSQEPVLAFFTQHIPDLHAQIALALNEFKEGYTLNLP
jgi:hypothetical protein